MFAQRTLVLVMDFAPNGDRSMEAFLIGLSEVLRKEGWRLIHCYSGEPSIFFNKKLNYLDIPFIMISPTWSIFSAFSLGMKLRKYSPDVVMTGYYSAFHPATLCLRWASGAKHWIVRSQSGGSVRTRSVIGEVLAKLRGVFVGSSISKEVAVSNFIRERDIQAVHLPANKIIVVPNGIDAERYQPKSRLEGDEIRVAYAGRLIPEKGVGTLLEAVAGLEVRPRLMIAGTGCQEDDLKMMAKRLKLSPEWLGQISWVPRLFSESEIVVVPSLIAEAFGFVVAEAMACGACVVGSNVGGIPEVIGDAGIVVPAGDAMALREALKSLINNPSRCRQIGVAARERIMENFTVSNMTTGYVNVIREVVGITTHA